MSREITAAPTPHDSNPYKEAAVANEKYFDSLLAFEDQGLFKKQLYAQNPSFRKNPDLHEDLHQTLIADDDQSLLDMIELIDISREIDTPTSATPFRAIMSQLTLNRELEQSVSKDIPGSKRRTHAIASVTTRHFSDAIPDASLYTYAVTAAYILKLTSESRILPPNIQAWFVGEANYIERIINQRIAIEEYFASMPAKDESPVSAEQIATDDLAVAELMTDIRSRQRYGVKIGYKPQQFRSGSIVFCDVPDHTSLDAAGYKNAHPIATNNRNAVAIAADSPKTSFKKKIRIEPANQVGSSSSFDFGIDARAYFHVGEDGSLYSALSDIPHATTAAKKGTYNAYRHLQAEILSAYADLVNPMETSTSIRALKSPAVTDAKYQQETGMDILRSLMIPRIQQKQIDTKPIDESNSTPREVRLHGVVWHIRRLPEGWHASPEALQLAREARISLAPGETFVRAHQRGSKKLGEVVIHKLVER